MRWTQKNGVNYFGYKHHRKYAVTDTAVHNSQVFEELLDEANSSREVLAYAPYRAKKSEERVEGKGFRPRLQHKGCHNKPPS